MSSSHYAITLKNTPFSMHPSRKKTFHELVLSVIMARSVQHQHLAAHMDSKYDVAARTQKIYRFFAETEFDYLEIAHLIVELTMQQDKPFHLILDRTNWKFGKIHINYLVLSLRIEGIGVVPLLWEVLDKAGNSNTNERIDLFERFFQAFPNAQVQTFTADREFIGDHWFNYLIQHKIKFYIRVKSNTIIFCGKTKVSLGEHFSSLSIGDAAEKLTFQIECDDGSIADLYVAAVRSKDDELVIVMTNQDRTADEILERYKTRWGIECMFGNMKQKGFNLEDTHMTNPERLKKLMAIIAIAGILCLRTGVIKDKFYPIKIKKTVKAKQHSYFQYGFLHIRAFFNKIINSIIDAVKTYSKRNFFFDKLSFGSRLVIKNE